MDLYLDHFFASYFTAGARNEPFHLFMENFTFQERTTETIKFQEPQRLQQKWIVCLVIGSRFICTEGVAFQEGDF